MNRHVIRQAYDSLVSSVREGDSDRIRAILWKTLRKLRTWALLPVALPVVVMIRLVRPWVLIRFNILTTERLGHFARNTELYLCERDAGINTPKMRHVDLWYHNWPVANRQLARMWGRVLRVWPAWILAPIDLANSIVPGGAVHQIGENTQIGRDVHNLLDRLPPHLTFLPEEEKKGEAGLRALGIPPGAPFVCLNVRDSSYLAKTIPWATWNYHDYRDGNIQNYVLAALELTKRGYYVVRVGAVVKEAMNVDHPMIIDYAAKGLRTDFMDIYLAAKCAFCISKPTGFECVADIFRRPIVNVDHVPLGVLSTFRRDVLATTKMHWLRGEGRFMTLREIFDSGADQFLTSNRYEELGIDLIESTPEEIAAVVLEMEARLSGTWRPTDEDEELQRRFWERYPKRVAYYNKVPLHGEIRSRFGTDFLRRHKAWLE